MNNKAIITEIDKALVAAIQIENRKAFGMLTFIMMVIINTRALSMAKTS